MMCLCGVFPSQSQRGLVPEEPGGTPWSAQQGEEEHVSKGEKPLGLIQRCTPVPDEELPKACRVLHRAMFEVEKESLCQSLDELKRDHEQYVKEVNADITTTRERYTQLRQEVLHHFFCIASIFTFPQVLFWVL